ncbi:MAG: cytochrome b [Parvibaculaceae bacterium]|nr:cytochrome b [Parvibaculaceae bacterium]
MSTTPATNFSLPARVLHWTMAVLILAMLFIGVGMVASISERHEWLVQIHKPLGIALLVLVVLRLFIRLKRGAPPLPADLPGIQRRLAHLSHLALYLLMFLMPLIGWSMLSAGGYPVILYGPVLLPPIVPENPLLFAILRQAHTYLAFLLFLTILGHLGAALYHGLIRRDGVFSSMARGKP